MESEIMSFSYALEELKQGNRVAREGWNGKGMYLSIQFPDQHSANTVPYIWIRTAKGDRVPWVASQSDLLMNDWVIVS